MIADPAILPATSVAFGKLCAERITASKVEAGRSGKIFTMRQVAAIIAELDSQRVAAPETAIPCDSSPKVATYSKSEREAFFEALREVCGYSTNITKTTKRTLAVCLSEIMAVDDRLSVEKIRFTGAAVMKKYDKAGPMAISKHWGQEGHTPPTKSARKDAYVEVANWQTILRSIGKTWDETALNEQLAKSWNELPITIRQEILKVIA